MKKNYRDTIFEIAQKHNRSGNECLETAILAGAPEVIDTGEALAIAEWLETDAPIEWNKSDEPLYDRIAGDIRSAVEESTAASTMGRKGGAVKSEAKTTAAREYDQHRAMMRKVMGY